MYNAIDIYLLNLLVYSYTIPLP